MVHFAGETERFVENRGRERVFASLYASTWAAATPARQAQLPPVQWPASVSARQSQQQEG